MSRDPKKIGPIVISACLITAAGAAGWAVVAFRPRGDSDRIYGAMAGRIGVDPGFWKKVGAVLDKATSPKHPALTQPEYELLYKSVETGKPSAQKAAFMALSCCPPKDRRACYQRLMKSVASSPDAEVQIWAYGLLWKLDTSFHAGIRLAALGSAFGEVKEVVPNWPEKLQSF